MVNSWRSRLYPTEADGPSKVAVFTQPKFCVYLPVSNAQCSIPEWPDGAKTVKPGSIFVVDYLDADILQFAAAGVTIIFNGNSTSPLEKAGAAIKLSTDSAVFKTAWCDSSVGLCPQF
eukprot:COSAG01_NODE_16019_length_1277_cov_94.981324_2_plen_118_part_00